jgi:hypothetical protein
MSASIPPSSYTSPATDRPPQGPRRQSHESIRSTRRKPVSYINVGEVNSGPTTDGTGSGGGETELVGGSTVTGIIEPVQPPAYILHPDRPMEEPQTNQTSPDLPPSYTYPPSSPTSTTTTTTSPTDTHAQLPAYHPSPSSTSPHTLPRTLFLWGFICPLLWIIGVIVLCVPLKVYEDDFDLAFDGRLAGRVGGEGVHAGAGVGRGDEEWEKLKQRERMLLDEKVVILRRVSRFPPWAFLMIDTSRVLVLMSQRFETHRLNSDGLDTVLSHSVVLSAWSSSSSRSSSTS